MADMTLDYWVIAVLAFLLPVVFALAYMKGRSDQKRQNRRPYRQEGEA